MIGKTIGNHQILGKLGEGGMGIVYKAEQMSLTRTVAMKILPKKLTGDSSFVQRFLNEALTTLLLVTILVSLGACSAESRELPFRSVDKGEYSGHAARKNYVITTIGGWERVWNETHQNRIPAPSPPMVDFARKMVIAVFQGTRKSGGYAVEISRVTETEEALEVFVKETFPPPGSMVTLALTNPYHIIEIQKVDKIAIFKHVRNEEVFDIVTPKTVLGSYASGEEGEAREELERFGVEYSGASFLESAENGDITTIKLLLKAGMDPDVTGEHEATALMVAARNGKVDVLNLLIEAGAEVDATAFMIAALHAQTEVVRALLRAGVDVNARVYKKTALTTAAVRGHAETVMALIAAGADVEARDAHGDTALVLAAREGHTRPACEDYTNIVRALLDAGADANARFHGGGSVLVFAAYGGCIEMVHDLLRAGADVNVRGRQGQTALHFASKKGYGEIAKDLIEAGADVNARDDLPWTVLIHAASQGHPEIVQALIDAGADVNAADRWDSTALIHLLRTGNTGRRHVETAKVLIRTGSGLDARERDDGLTALMIVARKCDTELAQALIDAGASVNIKDNAGRIALKHAEERGCTEIVQLLKYGRVDKKSERSEDEAIKVDQATTVDDTEWVPFEVKSVFDPTGSGDYIAIIRMNARSKMLREGEEFDGYEALKIDGPKKCITITRKDTNEKRVFCVGDKHRGY